ncbi:MAG: biotin/lipoyl-binding protein [Eubacteriales bacterium]|nr:biotin/lipoyl-binding protein [Eubacteriales bacterium]MDD3881963.1 biotin/lipoyl-binding protein [Eubacteriales bacterium]MDD4513136.1 biotin/lipoyl-binding protein [Eubacteriales bacterium]
MKHKALALIVLAAVLCFPAALAEDVPELVAPADAAMSKTPVIRGEITKMQPYSATVVPEIYPLAFPLSGIVGNVYVIPGQAVKKGEIIAELDVQDTLEAIEDLKEDAEYSKSAYEYQQRMREIDIQLAEMDLRAIENEAERAVKENDIELLKAQANEAYDTYILSKTALDERLRELEEKTTGTAIIAPVDGVIAAMRPLVSGSGVSDKDDVVWLADDSVLYVQCDFQKKEKMDAVVSVYALINGKEYACEYVPMEDSEYVAQTLMGGALYSRFSLNMAEVSGEIQSGMSAAICVVTQKKDDVLIVPSNAVYRLGAARFVYVIAEDQSMSLRSVTIGINTDLLTEVTSGLEEGELIYVKD